MFLLNEIYALNVGMDSKNADAPAAANAPLNTAGNRGILSQLGLPGASAASNLKGQESNNNLALELAQNNKMSPQVGPAVAAVAAASPSFLRLAGPSRHSALSTSANIVEAERRLREGSFSSTGPTAFIGNRNGSGGSSAFRVAGAVGAEGANGIELALGGAAGGGAEEAANEEPEEEEPDIFEEFEVTPDINADYAQDLFNDETLKNVPDDLFDNLVEALETIEEEEGKNNNNRNANAGTDANAVSILLALQKAKDKLIKLDQERSIKSSASSRNSARSLESVKESTEAISGLARELLRVGTSEVVGPPVEVPASGEKRTRSGRESRPPLVYNPEPVRSIIRRTKIKSKKQRPGSQLASGLSDVSNMTSLTATKAFLMAMKGSRIEGPSPDSQLKFIHGQAEFDSINGDTLCDLCGFALKFRQPDNYYKEGDKDYQQLKWSYDHTIPVNYAAAVLKIYLTNGHYSLPELQIMSFLGGPTCYHCNSVKSQQKFITCPNAKRFKWRDLRENVRAIDLFLSQLSFSSLKDKNAKNLEGNTSLQRQIDRIVPPARTRKEIHWQNIRRQYLVQKCRKICELIRNHVDYDKAYARVKLMRSVINGERAKLQSEGGLSARQIKSKISKKARDALFNCKVQPWNETVDLRDYQIAGGENPFYTPAVPILELSPEKAWALALAGAGVARTRRRKQMRKRTRKNLRSR